MALYAKVQAAITKLDSVLAGMTGADAKVAAEFKVVWDQFKATRDNERSYLRSSRATPPTPRRLPMAFNTSVCPRCGASCPADNGLQLFANAFSHLQLAATQLIAFRDRLLYEAEI
jgi:hypothetical protein